MLQKTSATTGEEVTDVNLETFFDL